MSIPVGTADLFPLGQCTYWADFRYHQLTGKYVPWRGDAKDWLGGAHTSQWLTSSQAPQGIPSIIILQPGVQGAGGLGHVGVVEKVNGDGSVVTSNLNWGNTQAQRAVTQTVTFHNGPGVSFAWMPGASGSIPTSSDTNNGTGNNSTTGTSDWIAQLGGEGVKIGIFILALVLTFFGLYMLFTKQVNSLVKKSALVAAL